MSKSNSWNREEWKHCLDCFAKSDIIDSAVKLHRKRYKDRTQESIMYKFRAEGLDGPSKYLKTSNKIDVDFHIDELRAQQKQEAIDRAEARELKEFKKRKQAIDLIIELVSDEIQRLPAPKVIKAINPKSVLGIDEELMFPVSDVQIGEFVEAKDIGGIGSYSLAIFEHRVSVWRDNVISMIKERMSKYNVKKIHIPFHGDIVEGMDIFQSQAFHLETGLVRQAVQGSRIFSEAVAAISESIGNSIEIELDHVGGNHGRIGRKGQTPYQDNWDRLFGFMMGTILEKYDNISNSIPEVWFVQKNLLGWVFHIEHGDDINSWMGIPAYGMIRAHAKNSIMWNNPIHFYLIGHHHVGSQIQNGFGEVLCNGNWVGANEFSAKIIKSHARPFQFMFVIRENHGIVERHMCYFEDIKTSMARLKEFSTRKTK